MNKINECPFCHSEDTDTVFIDRSLPASFAVTCNACNAFGPMEATKEQAIYSWNLATGIDEDD